MIRSAEPLLVAICVGLLSGTHAAIWGMYKDALHEGFSARSFARSILVGALAAVAVQSLVALPLPAPHAVFVLFGLAYAAERGLVEVWKTFVRVEDQSKYFIPMQFSVRGVPVQGRGIRFAAAVGYVAAVGACLYAIARLDRSAFGTTIHATVAVGLAVGLLVALGGAWKDAPTEGFDPVKFLRSPAVTVCCALVLSTLTSSALLIAAGAIGYERAMVETYKKFGFPMRAPGKFAGKPVLYPEMLVHRRWFVPVFVGIWLFVAASGVAALDDAGSSVTDRAAITHAGL